MSRAQTQTITVLGAGCWGTALALLLARNGWTTRLWGHSAERMAQVAAQGCNEQYLPDFRFPENLTAGSDLVELARATDCFLIVVPSHAFRATAEQLRAAKEQLGEYPGNMTIAWGTKGFEPGTAQLLSQVAEEVFGDGVRLGVASGPTFAVDVASGLPTALTSAARDASTAEAIAAWLRSDHVRVYANDDLIGVQLAGAIKNVMAIAAGVSDGLALGASARAALVTRGLAELGRLGVALGGRPETFMGLAGVGDLILTCTDDKSRNRRVGIGLGVGRGLDEILEDLGQEAEGVNTTRELYRMAQRLGVEMPITEQVYRVLFEGRKPEDAVHSLLTREPTKE